MYNRIVLSSHPSTNKNALDGCEPIYILSALDIKPLTKEDLRTKFEITKLKHPKWQDKPFETYCYWLAEMHQSRYEIETYDTAYFLDPNTAENYAKNNAADINEAGSYPYLAIYTRPTEHMYAESYSSEVTLFEYNPKTDKYDKIKDTSKEIYQYLLAQFNYSIKLPKEENNV